MEEKDENDIHIDLAGIDSLNNLDTARMTLRWALERLQLLDKLKTEAAQNAASSRVRMSISATAAVQSELYYARMEEWLLLHLSQNMESADLLTSLRRRQERLEREYRAGRGNLENDGRNAADSALQGEIRDALDQMQRQDDRMQHWEQVLKEKEGLEKARGGFGHTMDLLRGKLLEGPSTGEAAPQGEAEPSSETIERHHGGREARHAAEIAALKSAWQQERRALEGRLRELEAQEPAPAPATEPAPRELVEKFRLMLESWDAWEASQHQALEDVRRAQKEGLVDRLSQAQSPLGVHDILQDARKSAREAMGKARKAAIAEFRRTLDAWQREQAARQKEREDALTRREKRIEETEAALEAHREALQEAAREAEDRHKKEQVELREGLERASARREEDRERAHRLELDRIQARSEESDKERDRLKNRMEEAEERLGRILAEEREAHAQALRLREAEMEAAKNQARVAEESLRAASAEDVRSEAESLRKRLQEQESLQSHLLAEQKKFSEILAARDAQIAALKSEGPKPSPASEPPGQALELAAREAMLVQREKEMEERLAREISAAAQSAENVRRELAEALKAKESELEALRAQSSVPGAAGPEAGALEQRLREQERTFEVRLAEQEKEFRDLALKLTALCAAYRRELET